MCADTGKPSGTAGQQRRFRLPYHRRCVCVACTLPLRLLLLLLANKATTQLSTNRHPVLAKKRRTELVLMGDLNAVFLLCVRKERERTCVCCVVCCVCCENECIAMPVDFTTTAKKCVESVKTLREGSR